MFKNVASQKLIVYAFDSTTSLPKTGDAANLTAYVSKDYGTVTVLGDTSATEMDSTNAKGYYLFDLTQAETNADTLLFSCKSSTANIVVVGSPATVFTLPANFSSQSIDSNGRLDVIKIAGTTQTARDIGASVLLSSGTGTGQLDFTSGRVKADTVYWNASAVSVPTNAGVPNVNVKTWNDLATVALPLVPTTAGRTLDVSAGGEAGIDWANVGSPTTTLALTGTTIATTQKVDVETIKTNPVVNAGTVTFPTTATLASTTNITAGTITTVTNLTNAPTSGDFTATMKTSLSAATPVCTLSGDLTSTMKTSVTTACTASTPTAAAVTGNVGGNVVGSVGSVTGLTASDVGAIKTKTDSLTFTVAGMVDSNVIDWKGATAPAMTGDAFARLGAPAGGSVSADIAAINSKTTNLPSDPADESLIIAATDAIMTRMGAPAGASVSADIAAVKTDSAAIKAKTDQLTFTTANKVDATATTTIDATAGHAIADYLLDRTDGIETGVTPRQAHRIMLSGIAGKASGLQGNAAVYRDVNDTKNRIAATVDDNGNRTSVTLDAT